MLRHCLNPLSVAHPLLRPLRLLQLVTLLRVLNGRQRAGPSATTGLRSRLTGVSRAGRLCLRCAEVWSSLDAKRSNPDVNILTFGDPMWWAVPTMTTVGYGVRYPTTSRGRLIA